jgi:hypothetical protein
LDGDIEAVLIFLRNTSFGPEYKVSVTDPQTGKPFSHTVVLDELNIKKTQHQPDEHGTFITTLPKSGVSVKLKPLSFAETTEISKMSEQYPAGRTAPIITWRLAKQIVEINGNESKEQISNFINSMPIMDSKYIRSFIRENQPSLDLTKTVKAPSGDLVTFEITFGVEFFGLSSNHKQLLIEEYYFLARFIRLSYTEFHIMPTYMRKYLIDRIIEDNTPKT